MVSDDYDTRRRMWPKFPNICLTVEEKSQKNLNQEIDSTGDRTEPAACEASTLPLDHSGGQKNFECFTSKPNAHGTFEICILKLI